MLRETQESDFLLSFAGVASSAERQIHEVDTRGDRADVNTIVDDFQCPGSSCRGREA